MSTLTSTHTWTFDKISCPRISLKSAQIESIQFVTMNVHVSNQVVSVTGAQGTVLLPLLFTSFLRFPVQDRI